MGGITVVTFVLALLIMRSTDFWRDYPRMEHFLRRQDPIAAANASTVPTSTTAQPDQILTAATTTITCMLPDVTRMHNPAVTLTQNAKPKPEPGADFNPESSALA